MGGAYLGCYGVSSAVWWFSSRGVILASMQLRILEAQTLGPRETQQDRLLSMQAGDWAILAVFDGMGGHRGGAEAAEAAARAFEIYAETQVAPRTGMGEWVERGLKYSHRMATRASSGGTTATVVAVHLKDKRGVCVWAGDSPAYHLYDAGHHAVRCGSLTKPHGMGNQLFNGIGSVFQSPYFDSARFDLAPTSIIAVASDGIDAVRRHSGWLFMTATRSRDLLAILNQAPLNDNTTVILASVT